MTINADAIKHAHDERLREARINLARAQERAIWHAKHLHMEVKQARRWAEIIDDCTGSMTARAVEGELYEAVARRLRMADESG